MTITQQPALDGASSAPTRVVGLDTLEDPEFMEVRRTIEGFPEVADHLPWDRLNGLALAIQEALAGLRRESR
ncbi:hypothetical protein [Frankia gtarii]|uniref:hypothetical protein n=1 Tax=Frankia gtarii TaxID=2950102 RepID=UPI0021BEE3EA|nr:hypothetical protein [Frankia gtarii]